MLTPVVSLLRIMSINNSVYIVYNGFISLIILLGNLEYFIIYCQILIIKYSVMFISLFYNCFEKLVNILLLDNINILFTSEHVR